jgi:hypothetical protein
VGKAGIRGFELYSHVSDVVDVGMGAYISTNAYMDGDWDAGGITIGLNLIRINLCVNLMKVLIS